MDIKPANIILDYNKERKLINCKLGDFGAMKFLPQNKEEMTKNECPFQFSKPYASPELISQRKDKFSPKQYDAFSVGILALELTGVQINKKFDDKQKQKKFRHSKKHGLQSFLDFCKQNEMLPEKYYENYSNKLLGIIEC